MKIPPKRNVEVEISHEGGKAVIQGKTNVPFKVFVQLVLQRKVQGLFRDWQNEPVVIGSELLTSLASAPGDTQEDRGNVILVTLAAGMFLGVFLTLGTLVVLSFFDIRPTNEQFLLVMGGLLLVVVILKIMQRAQRRPSTKQKVAESMEKLSELLSK